MTNYDSRNLPPVPRIVGRDPADYAQELQDILEALQAQTDVTNVLYQTETLGIGAAPGTIQAGQTADPGTSGSGWIGADATFAVETAAPTNPTGTAAAEGSGTALMRADATVKQGIVTTKGDVLGFSTVPAKLAVGSDALGLTADSGQATGLRWGPVVLSPAQIVANTNDYAPGRANVYRLSTDASRNLTGLVAGTSGERRTIANIGAQPLVIKHQDAGSAIGNRFLCTTAADITLAADEIAEILYDATTARWRVAKW